MTEDLMRMASFRIDKELWAKFGAIAKRERLTVTDVLTDYIQRCTDNDRTEYAVNTSNDRLVITDTYDNDKLVDTVMTVINTMSLPSNDDVNACINDAIDNRVLPLIEAVREELKRATNDRSVTTESLAEPLLRNLTHS
jgi:antitoxin component of RelBE/YafQ-DinJ toxin-antitoxin module